MVTPLVFLSLLSLRGQQSVPTEFDRAAAQWEDRLQRVERAEPKVRDTILAGWGDRFKEEHRAFNAAYHDALRRNASKGKGYSDIERRIVLRREGLIGKLANLMELRVQSTDRSEFLAWARFACSGSDFYSGNRWSPPTCGTYTGADVHSFFWRAQRQGIEKRFDWSRELLQDSNPVVVMNAASTLHDIRPAEIWPLIKRCQADARPKWRAIPLAVVPDESPEYDAVIREALSDEDADIRDMAIGGLYRHNDKGRSETLFRMMVPGFLASPVELQMSLLTLGEHSQTDDLYHEANRLRRSSHPQLRAQAVNYLIVRKHWVSSDELRWGIAHGSFDTRFACVEAAAKHPDMAADLFTLLGNEDLRWQAWDSLCDTADLKLIPSMVHRLLTDLDPETGERTLQEDHLGRALARLGSATDAIARKLYTNRDLKVRALAAGVAATRTSLLDLVDSAMKSPEERVRRAVAEHLYRMPHAEALPRLRLLLSDADQSTRQWTISSLLEFGGAEDERLIRSMLKHPDKNTSDSAAHALEEIGQRKKAKSSQGSQQ